MANAHPATPASMRHVRDKYLDILLTGGTSAPPPPSQSWTPGHNFGVNQPWTSPVTPGPSENDVRMAEIAAGLVAAGGVEARQTDTIRRLAEQLGNSEKRLRDLEKETKRKDGEKSGRKSVNRHIRFTPRSGGPDTTRNDRRKKRPEIDDVDTIAELAVLRRERREWEAQRKQSEREAASLSQMMTEIRQNTKRLVEERDDQLKVIGNLKEELSNAKQQRKDSLEEEERQDELKTIERLKTELTFAKQQLREAEDVPLHPHSVRGVDRTELPHMSFHRDEHARSRLFEDIKETASPSVRQLDFGAGIHGEFGEGDEDSPTPEDHERIAGDLREELRLVLAENERLSERVPHLEAECLDLARRLRNAEKEIKARQEEEYDVSVRVAQSQPLMESEAGPAKHGHEGNAETFSLDGVLPLDVPDIVLQLVDEIIVLEGVSDAINFCVSPLEVDELQETVTGLSITRECFGKKISDLAEKKPLGDSFVSTEVALASSLSKVVRVREGLSMRYGQWLKAVAVDETTTNVSAFSKSTEGLESVDSMNTGAIDRLFPSTLQ